MRSGLTLRRVLPAVSLALFVGCGEDRSTDAGAVRRAHAAAQRAAVARTAYRWATDRDCSLISVSYAIRHGGSPSAGRASCDATYAYVSGRTGYRVGRVAVSGDGATAEVLTPGGRRVVYSLVRDGLGRWRIDDDPGVRYCTAAGRVTSGALELCGKGTDFRSRGFIVNSAGGERTLLDVSAPYVLPDTGEPLGGWEWAAASPDGETILAQWSGTCEVPHAFVIPARGGRPRTITGETPNRAPESIALGWTTDGRAIVFVPREPGCGDGSGPGVYLVSLAGERTFLAAAKSSIPPKALPRSVTPRTVAAVKRAVRPS